MEVVAIYTHMHWPVSNTPGTRHENSHKHHKHAWGTLKEKHTVNNFSPLPHNEAAWGTKRNNSQLWLFRKHKYIVSGQLVAHTSERGWTQFSSVKSDSVDAKPPGPKSN